jgi:hypothetical protein
LKSWVRKMARRRVSSSWKTFLIPPASYHLASPGRRPDSRRLRFPSRQRQIEGDPPLPEADHPFCQQRQQRRIMHDGDQRRLSRRLTSRWQTSAAATGRGRRSVRRRGSGAAAASAGGQSPPSAFSPPESLSARVIGVRQEADRVQRGFGLGDFLGRENSVSSCASR